MRKPQYIPQRANFYLVDFNEYYFYGKKFLSLPIKQNWKEQNSWNLFSMKNVVWHTSVVYKWKFLFKENRAQRTLKADPCLRLIYQIWVLPLIWTLSHHKKIKLGQLNCIVYYSNFVTIKSYSICICSW